MRRKLWTFVAAAAVMGAAACDGGDPLQVTAQEGGALEISVSQGIAPTYTWVGPARRLVVRGGGEVFWEIDALDAGAGFTSPVQHGDAPAAARVVTQARLLEAGQLFTVTVVGTDGSEGTRSFTPSTP